MQGVLRLLRDAADADNQFVHLPPRIDGRTIRALLKRDWIFESRGLDGLRYTITGRGRKALKVYEQPGHRFDGMCFDCGEPKHVTKNGYRYPYCWACTQKHDKRKRAFMGNQLNPDTPCSRCKKRRRHVYSSGKVVTYCSHCLKIKRRAEKKRRMKRLVARIEAGEFIGCIRCKVQPRWRTRNTVFDYCFEHFREIKDRSLERRKQQQPPAPPKKRGRPRLTPPS